MTKIYLKNDHCPACKSVMDIIGKSTVPDVFPDDFEYQCTNKKCGLNLPHNPAIDTHFYCPKCFSDMLPVHLEKDKMYCPTCHRNRLKKNTNHA